jgi:DNA-binding NarL/FixJ family response regulator
MSEIQVVLADDHRVVLEGLEQLLRHEPGFAVVAACIDGIETLEAVRRLRPDVLVLDLRMPRLDGVGVLREMRREDLPTRVVVLTAGIDEQQMVDAVRLGARGVVLKEMASRLLVQCLHKVHAGETWLETRSAAAALEALMRRETATAEWSQLLTPREMLLVRMIARGLRNKEIGDELHIGEGTVKTHLHNIYRKLGVDGRLALLRAATDKGLV